jgi:hypothetical protein
MALDKATNLDMKSFAQTRSTTRSKLKTVVSEHGIDWPAQLDDKLGRSPTSWGRNRGRISIATM